jgi:hypothetical protein
VRYVPQSDNNNDRLDKSTHAYRAHAIQQSISSEGTVDDLRRRLRDFFRHNPTALTPTNHEGERATVGSHESEPKTEVFLTLSAGPSRPLTPRCDDDRGSYFSAADPPAPAITLADPARTMDQIRKWGCYFEGKDPVTFLERVDELQARYRYSGAQMLLGLPELLRGEPLLWYRNRRRAWSS